jgi:hypothetical protein
VNFGPKKEIFNGNYTKTYRIYPNFTLKQKFTGMAKNSPKHCP